MPTGCNMAIRRNFLLVLAAAAIAAGLFAALHDHHRTPEPAALVVTGTRVQKLLATTHTGNGFQLITCMPPAEGKCLFRRHSVILDASTFVRMSSQLGFTIEPSSLICSSQPRNYRRHLGVANCSAFGAGPSHGLTIGAMSVFEATPHGPTSTDRVLTQWFRGTRVTISILRTEP